MANCTVKRTAVITLVMDENEARCLRTILGKVKGGRTEVNALNSVLMNQGVTPHLGGELKGELSWEAEVPF